MIHIISIKNGWLIQVDGGPFKQNEHIYCKDIEEVCTRLEHVLETLKMNKDKPE